jgi:hypothetical protein
MATRNPPGTGMLRLVAAMLLIGGPILALAFRSWGVGSLVFGLGAIVLGIRQVRLGGHRSERFLGIALLLGGAFTGIEGLVRLLFGAAPQRMGLAPCSCSTVQWSVWQPLGLSFQSAWKIISGSRILQDRRLDKEDQHNDLHPSC